MKMPGTKAELMKRQKRKTDFISSPRDIRKELLRNIFPEENRNIVADLKTAKHGNPSKGKSSAMPERNRRFPAAPLVQEFPEGTLRLF